MNIRLYSLLFCALAFAAPAFASVGDTFKDGDFYYTVTSDGAKNKEVEIISRYQGSFIDGEVYIFPDSQLVIPAVAISPAQKSYTVTAVGSGAFSDCKSLKSATIPASVRYVGFCAFSNCDKLTSLTIEDSENPLDGDYSWVTDIVNIESMYIGRDLTTDGSESHALAFHYSPYHDQPSYRNLRSVVFGDMVSSKFLPTLWNLPELVHLKLGSGMTTLTEFFLYECPALTTLSIPASVELIEMGSCVRVPLESLTFEDSTEPINVRWGYGSDNYDPTHLQYLYLGRNLKSNDAYSLSGKSPLTELIIGDDVTIVPESVCFHGTMKSVTLGKNVRIISQSAFNGPKLQSVTLNEGLEEIGDYAFDSSVFTTLRLPSTLRKIGLRALPETLAHLDIHGVDLEVDRFDAPHLADSEGYFEIPACVKAFKAIMPGVKRLHLADTESQITALPETPGIEEIYVGRPIYERCYYGSGIKKVTVGGGAHHVADHAFCKCASLETLLIQPQVETIGEYAFDDTDALTYIHFPYTLKSLGEYSFWFINRYKTIYIAATTPPALDGNVWSLSYSITSTLYVPIGCTDAYKNSGWGDFNILEYDAAGIDSIDTDAVAGTSAVYYDLRGMRLPEPPASGLFIERRGDDSRLIMR